MIGQTRHCQCVCVRDVLRWCGGRIELFAGVGGGEKAGEFSLLNSFLSGERIVRKQP